MTIHRNQSYMCLMNFKLKSTVIGKKKLWSKIILKRKKNRAKTFGAVASTQPQTNHSFQGKKNRLLVSCNRSYPLKVLFDSLFTLFSVLGRFQN